MSNDLFVINRTVTSRSAVAPCSITLPSGNQTKWPSPKLPSRVTSVPCSTADVEDLLTRREVGVADESLAHGSTAQKVPERVVQGEEEVVAGGRNEGSIHGSAPFTAPPPRRAQHSMASCSYTRRAVSRVLRFCAPSASPDPALAYGVCSLIHTRAQSDSFGGAS